MNGIAKEAKMSALGSIGRYGEDLLVRTNKNAALKRRLFSVLTHSGVDGTAMVSRGLAKQSKRIAVTTVDY